MHDMACVLTNSLSILTSGLDPVIKDDSNKVAAGHHNMISKEFVTQERISSLPIGHRLNTYAGTGYHHPPCASGSHFVNFVTAIPIDAAREAMRDEKMILTLSDLAMSVNARQVENAEEQLAYVMRDVNDGKPWSRSTVAASLEEEELDDEFEDEFDYELVDE